MTGWNVGELMSTMGGDDGLGSDMSWINEGNQEGVFTFSKVKRFELCGRTCYIRISDWV